MFAGNAGLASDAQACLEFGNWDYVGFERDTTVWQQSGEVIQAHMTALDRKEKAFRNRIKANMKLLPILDKIKSSGIESLTEAEVRYCLNRIPFVHLDKVVSKGKRAGRHRVWGSSGIPTT